MNEGVINNDIFGETGGGNTNVSVENNPFGSPVEDAQNILQDEPVKKESGVQQKESTERLSSAEKEAPNPFGEPISEDESTEQVVATSDGGEQPRGLFDGESEVIDALCGVFEKEYGWNEIPKDVRPKSAKDFVEYVAAIIAQNSEPEYAHPASKAFDEYVRAGGNPDNYFQASAQFNFSNINLQNPYDCQRAVGALLQMNGYTNEQIADSINEYQKAGILQKEATKAAEKLHAAGQYQQQAMVEEQKKQAHQMNQYVEGIKEGVGRAILATDEIMGTPLSMKDKEALFAYMVQPLKNGSTRFEMDYMSHPMHLVHAAYICMMGKNAFSNVKRSAQKNAMENFRSTIRQQNVRHREAPRVTTKASSSNSPSSASYWSDMLNNIKRGRK